MYRAPPPPNAQVDAFMKARAGRENATRAANADKECTKLEVISVDPTITFKVKKGTLFPTDVALTLLEGRYPIYYSDINKEDEPLVRSYVEKGRPISKSVNLVHTDCRQEGRPLNCLGATVWVKEDEHTMMGGRHRTKKACRTRRRTHKSKKRSRRRR